MFRQFVDVDIAFNLNTFCSISFGFSKVRWFGFDRLVFLQRILIFFFCVDEINSVAVTSLENCFRKWILFLSLFMSLYFVGVDTRFLFWFCDGSWEFILVCAADFRSLGSFYSLLESDRFNTLSSVLNLNFTLPFHRNKWISLNLVKRCLNFISKSFVKPLLHDELIHFVVERLNNTRSLFIRF